MAELPTLATPRLLLRALTASDAPRLQQLADDRQVASTTRRLPSPYTLRDAESFLESARQDCARGVQAVFAIVPRELGALVGVIGLGFEMSDGRAELGYWLGRAYWNCGYATEAAAAIVRYGFELRGLHRIFAYCLARNPASRRVLEKVGFVHEGCLRQHNAKWGVYEDLDVLGLLAAEWRGRQET